MEKTKEQLEQERLEKERLEEEEKKKKQSKSYTEEEIAAIVQKESDKRVTEAVKTREEKLRKEMDEKIAQERAEAERVARLTAEEKEREHRAKTQKDLEERELRIKQKELLSDTKDLLHAEKLPVSFASVLVGKDIESTKENIKNFKTSWLGALESEVNEKLKGKLPKHGNAIKGDIQPEDFKKMSYEKRLELKKQNPELYEQLMGRKGD